MKRLTLKEFIDRARKVHGNKYDYSKVRYINSSTKVIITCPIHGDFLQAPSNHTSGQGCWFCGNEKNSARQIGVAKTKERTIKFGRGIFDYEKSVSKDKSYITWLNMLKRCYDENVRNKFPTYKECEVCDEWLSFTAFKQWYDKNYIEGYVIDKDILYKGNKIYSPDTCCFVPQEINAMLTKGNSIRGNLPLGVVRYGKRFLAQITINKKYIKIGVFDTPEEAFNAYKNIKESHIRNVAKIYLNAKKITTRVYNALVCHKIEITD